MQNLCTKVFIESAPSVFSPAFGNFYQTNFITLVRINLCLECYWADSWWSKSWLWWSDYPCYSSWFIYMVSITMKVWIIIPILWRWQGFGVIHKRGWKFQQSNAHLSFWLRSRSQWLCHCFWWIIVFIPANATSSIEKYNRWNYRHFAWSENLQHPINLIKLS